MTRPIILVDIDGVFANFIERALPTVCATLRSTRTREAYEAGNFEAITHEHIVSYKMEEVFGLKPHEIACWHDWHVKQPKFCAKISPYPGAREAIAELQKIGDVHPVSWPWPKSPYWIAEREDWLAEQLGIDPGMSVQTSQKALVFGNVFIEDTTKHLVNWRNRWRDGVGIRIARPYNKSEKFELGVTVDTLAQVVDEVRHAMELRETRIRNRDEDFNRFP